MSLWFTPEHNSCLECGSLVQMYDAQQLVTTDRQHWYRMHQECFDKMRAKQRKEALALVSESTE